MTTSLSHSDSVSGTYILDDGTKCYWTEGRSSFVTVVKPDGTRTEMSVARLPDDPWLREVFLNMNQLEEEDGWDEAREMTPVEEKEWAKARA